MDGGRNRLLRGVMKSDPYSIFHILRAKHGNERNSKHIQQARGRNELLPLLAHVVPCCYNSSMFASTRLNGVLVRERATKVEQPPTQQHHPCLVREIS